jgi:hypothetical protein
VPTLNPADEGRLYRALRRLLAEAVEQRGSSIDDYTAPGGDGAMQERLRVYQRTGEPCPRCGRPIRRMVLGSRATHFCSWCQRLPRADRSGAVAVLQTMMPAVSASASTGPKRARRGRSRGWSELPGPPAIGLTPAEAELAELRERARRTRTAAAARRARARSSASSA